jgi:hypothetical protein
MTSLTPSSEQKVIVDLLKENNVTVDATAGSGKCHALNTPILMFDGSIKMVQDIQVGDLLMGDDSTPRKVLSLGRGRDTMYEIIPTKGESYVFNSEHILSLKYSNLGSIHDKRSNKWIARWFDNQKIIIQSKKFETKEQADKHLTQFTEESKICDISIKHFLQLSDQHKHQLKLYRVSVEFPHREIPFDPYIIGLWIGDGTSSKPSITTQDSEIICYLKKTLPKYDLFLQFNQEYDYSFSDKKSTNRYTQILKQLNLINNKHIPDIYKINSREIRLQILAGILDTDGHLGKNGCYEFVQKNEKVMDDVIFLARSLGFAAYKSIKKTSWTYLGIKKFGIAFRTTISGNIEEIPCKIKCKQAQPREQIKNVLVTGFKVIEKKIDDYYGFTLDGNHRYLLGNFTVTHNTSTILFIAEKYKDLSILVLTYNSQLKAETRKRAVGYQNIDVHSYHSFCVANYDKSAHTDDKVNDVIRLNFEPCCDIMYDIIIADESQDITPLLYRLLCKILTDNKKRTECKILIMGDQMQSIYKFRESDSRFITFSDQIFNKFNNFKWINCNLSETFRCTEPMVDFINDCMIGYKRLISNKYSKFKPDYIICNSYSYPSTVIENYLKVYKPHEIFVLAYSIKDKTPIKHLANYVTNNLNIPIYCSGSDQESLDSRVIENKLVFTTIHQAKGRERKAVLFIGFDESYFEYYDKVTNQKICPNELYVAVTRASEKLTLIHDAKKNYLPFLNYTMVSKYTNFQYKQTKENPIRRNLPNTNDTYTVSDLVSYLPFSIEILCMNYINVKIIREPDSKLDVPSIIKMTNGIGTEKVEIYESVSDITGVAIPAHFEYTKLGKSSLFSKNLIERNIYRIENGNYESKTKIAMITKLKKFSKTLKEFHKTHIENMDIKKLDVSDLLKISLYYSAQQNKTDYKLKQITKFDWLTKDILDVGTERLTDVVKGKNLLFEESIEGNFFGNNIIGEIDCISKDTLQIFEFKCTKDLTLSHMIQLGIYMGICMSSYSEYKNYKYLLFNIFTNELRELSGTFEDLQEMIKILIEHKIVGEIMKSDDDFLKEFSKYEI